MNEETVFRLGLANIQGIGPVTAKKLVTHLGSAKNVFLASKRELISIAQIGTTLASKISQKKDFSAEENQVYRLQKDEVKILFFDDESYPYRLKQQIECPFMIQYLGTDILNYKRIISFVGTRNPTRYGLNQCEKLIEHFKAYDIVVTSGLAFGIDAAAHQAALKHGIPTIAVLGSGIDKIYPPDHLPLAKKIISNGGLISQFNYHSSAEREHFPMRNSIIAALCDALVIIQSDSTGGSMITATLANHFNKDVFALPGNVNERYSQGCHQLILNHKASIFQTAEDIATFMNWETLRPNLSRIQKTFFPELNEDEKIIVTLFEANDTLRFETLAGFLKKTPSKLAALLLQLELKGVIKAEPGNMYSLL
jgi:DNA processing protein